VNRQTRAAENAYRSQGVAIERAANQQRRRRRRTAGPPSPPPRAPRPRPSGPSAFEPFRAKHGIERQQQRARRRTRRAANRLPDNPHVPHIPVIAGGYTPRQRTVIRQTLRSAAKRGGYGSLEELYSAASPRQRQQLRRVGRIVTYGPQVARDPQGLAGLREHNLRDTVSAKQRYPVGHKALQAAALFGDPSHKKLLRGGRRDRRERGRAFYEDPTQVARRRCAPPASRSPASRRASRRSRTIRSRASR
jgi:hypothetical protein